MCVCLGGISFALLTTDHKNTKGSKDEMKKRGGGITATTGVAEHRGVRKRGLGWEESWEFCLD